MKREVDIFFTALMFYTRIPCPKWISHDSTYLNLSTKYFPLIGWIVGGISFGILWSTLLLDFQITAIVLSIIASIFVTGGFHEDGFADMCDGFGGGWTKEKILTIMKDSRVGTYGAAGLCLILLLKITLITEWVTLIKQEPIAIALFLVSAHSLSRWVTSTFIYTHEYSREDELSKAKPVAKKVPLSIIIIGSLWWLIPFSIMVIYLEQYTLAAVPILLYFIKIRLGKYFNKWLGGYTGDCLGATQQVTEVAFYFFTLAIYRMDWV